MPRLRIRTVSTKVSEEDYALFAQLAGDQKVGEWVSNVLFKAVLSERPAEAHRTILGRFARPADDPAEPTVHRRGGGAGDPRPNAGLDRAPAHARDGDSL